MQATRRPAPHIPAVSAPEHRRRHRNLQAILRSIVLWLFILSTAALPARAADIDILKASIESTEEGYRLSTTYSFELNHGLETTIMRGVPLYFTTEVELTRRRWYWFDQTAVAASQTTRVSYNVLTRQYHASVNSSLQQNFATLDDAMAMVRRPPRWIIADHKALLPGETYNVAVRMRLDVAQLSKPFQVNALNNSDWRLSSNWINFSFRPE
jgi:uncharacterized protein DUF4390